MDPIWNLELNAYSLKKDKTFTDNYGYNSSSSLKSNVISSAILYQLPKTLFCDPYIGFGFDVLTHGTALGGHLVTGFDYSLSEMFSVNAEIMYLKLRSVDATSSSNSYKSYDYSASKIDPSGIYLLGGIKYIF